MYQFLPDFLFAPRGELSDDEEGKLFHCIDELEACNQRKR